MSVLRDADVTLFVTGTLMRGEELHGNLDGAVFEGVHRTVGSYRLYSIGDRHPAMVPVGRAGASVEGELYAMPLSLLARVLADEPRGVGLGVVELESGALTLGMVWVDGEVPRSAADISQFGGWREYRRMCEDQTSPILQGAGEHEF